MGQYKTNTHQTHAGDVIATSRRLRPPCVNHVPDHSASFGTHSKSVDPVNQHGIRRVIHRAYAIMSRSRSYHCISRYDSLDVEAL